MKLEIILFTLLLLLCGAGFSSVEPTSGRYVDSVEDLSIQIIGGPLLWERGYEDKKWRFNRNWSSLVFEHDTELKILYPKSSKKVIFIWRRKFFTDSKQSELSL